MNVKMYAYKMGSEGAKLLCAEMGIKRIRSEGEVIRCGALINWGSGSLPARIKTRRILNAPASVQKAANKISAFKAMEGKANIPEFTTSMEKAIEWAEQGNTVVCRKLVNGHGGAGIVLAEKKEEVVKAPLYTKYVPKKDEYRVHVMGGEMIHKQRKARRRDVEDENVNWKIRNHDNGFIFQVNDFEIPQDAIDQSIAAVNALGLDFGAVDVIWSAKEQKAYVLEVNTAPGVSGTTLEKYNEGFRKLLG